MNVLCNWNIQVFLSFPLTSEYKGVCVCVCGDESERECRPRLIRGLNSMIYLWIVKAVVGGAYQQKENRTVSAIRTKRSTSCIVYYCSTVKNEPWWEHPSPDECEHPPDRSILEVFGAVSVLQVYVNTMTLQHFLCLSRSVLPFLPNQITSLLLICHSLLPRHPLPHEFYTEKSRIAGYVGSIHSCVVQWSALKKPGKVHSGSQRYGSSNVLLSTSLNYFKWLFLNYFKT